MKKTFLKLGFQGWFLVQPHTGIGKHCAGLLKALVESKKSELVVVVPKPLTAAQLKELGLLKKQVFVLKPKSWPLHSSLKKWFWESVQVPTFLATQNVDWEYYPYPCPLPSKSEHLRAMTVHDMILWNDERYQGNKLKEKYYRDALRALIHVDHLFTVSKATHDQLGIPAATLLPNAVTVPKLAPAKKSVRKSSTKDLVYLGGYELRKNVPLLLRRFAELHKTHSEYRLLLIGEPHQKSKLYPELPEHPAVLHLGRKTDAEVFALLQNAHAFVHASDSEGFNLPLLEAMLAGTPAIVSDLEVNREVSRNTALFWNPSKKNSLEAILKSIQAPSKRNAIILRQKKAAHSYSWKHSAQLLLKALRP